MSRVSRVTRLDSNTLNIGQRLRDIRNNNIGIVTAKIGTTLRIQWDTGTTDSWSNTNNLAKIDENEVLSLVPAPNNTAGKGRKRKSDVIQKLVEDEVVVVPQDEVVVPQDEVVVPQDEVVVPQDEETVVLLYQDKETVVLVPEDTDKFDPKVLKVGDIIYYNDPFWINASKIAIINEIEYNPRHDWVIRTTYGDFLPNNFVVRKLMILFKFKDNRAPLHIYKYLADNVKKSGESKAISDFQLIYGGLVRYRRNRFQ